MKELQKTELAEPLAFTKGCRTLKIPTVGQRNSAVLCNLLFDLEADPMQERPITDAAVERKMINHLIRLMRQCDAPPEQYQRLGLAM